MNQRDARQEELTADEQGHTQRDLKITQQIRKAIIRNKALTVNAHNVKIITKRGIVTLKGPVASMEERKQIEDIAATVVSKKNIQSELGIVNNKSY